jgi:hypothetical protein
MSSHIISIIATGTVEVPNRLNDVIGEAYEVLWDITQRARYCTMQSLKEPTSTAAAIATPAIGRRYRDCIDFRH